MQGMQPGGRASPRRPCRSGFGAATRTPAVASPFTFVFVDAYVQAGRQAGRAMCCVRGPSACMGLLGMRCLWMCMHMAARLHTALWVQLLCSRACISLCVFAHVIIHVRKVCLQGMCMRACLKWFATRGSCQAVHQGCSHNTHANPWHNAWC